MGDRWESEGQPEAHHSFRQRGTDYRWLIRRGDDRRRFGVFISADAQEAVDERVELRPDVREAVVTRGRSLIEALGDADDPPEWYTVLTDGIRAGPPEGES